MADPYCLAMILCDAVHRDPATGKHTILGTFSTVGAKEYPTTLRFGVFFAITDGHGDFELRFRLVDAKDVLSDTAEPVFEVSAPARFETPLMVIEGSLRVTATLASPGVYHCEMLANENLLMSRRLVAIQPGESGGKEERDE